MKLWQKNTSASPSLQKQVEDFTVGSDKHWDLYLAESDVLGSIAHATMLEAIGLLSSDESRLLKTELTGILENIKEGKFKIDDGVEDVHSQIELLLTKSLGDVGKKIHSGRSRNDQSLLDIKLFLRKEITEISALTQQFFDTLLYLSEKHKADLLPGYTHMQLAMPSSFGLWFGAFAESLSDDLEFLIAAYKILNKNPLGSGAGYGSSFPLDRQLTSNLLGFDGMNINVVYAQMTRGKSEKTMAVAMAAIAATLSKMSMDVCLYMNQNFGFLSFPDELTTGSSIMPHKKNPDVFELVRAKCNRIQALPNELSLLTNNLPSGYHRDLQLTKECLFPAVQELKNCLIMLDTSFRLVNIKKNILEDEKYKLLFTVEKVNQMVLSGTPFRDAYNAIAQEVENGTFMPSTAMQHIHEGSAGNLCNDKIRDSFYAQLEQLKVPLYNELKISMPDKEKLSNGDGQ